MTNSRLEVARAIKQEVTKYLSKQGYSCHHEIGLNKGGQLRADVLAFNYKQNCVIVEVKSCWQDYVTDTKFLEYIDFCNKFYLAVSSEFPLKPEFLQKLKDNSIGLLIVDLTSDKLHLYGSQSTNCLLKSKSRSVEPNVISKIILRIAYRNGKLRTNKRKWMYVLE